MHRSLTRRNLARAALLPLLLVLAYLLFSHPAEVRGLANVAAFTQESFPAAEVTLPALEAHQCNLPGGGIARYMLQVPPGTPHTLLIYAHGADGDETQGMDCKYASRAFERLRIEVLRRGWLYATAQGSEFTEIVSSLKNTFQIEQVYLAGVSMGGNRVYHELSRQPSAWSGGVLISPAVPPRPEELALAGRLTMPLFVAVGTDDNAIATFCRRLAAVLEHRSNRFMFVEIPNQGHSGIVQRLDWKKALDFVSNSNTSRIPTHLAPITSN